MTEDEKFYHFQEGHYFYFDREGQKRKEKMVVILDVNFTKFVFAIPVDLIIKALKDHDKI